MKEFFDARVLRSHLSGLEQNAAIATRGDLAGHDEEKEWDLCEEY